jgi:hypothetical protein
MTPIPAEIDTGIPMDRKRSPLQPGRPEGAKAAGRAACLSLRRPREFCKPYRDRLPATLVTELEVGSPVSHSPNRCSGSGRPSLVFFMCRQLPGEALKTKHPI